jgi:hypothetical protein
VGECLNTIKTAILSKRGLRITAIPPAKENSFIGGEKIFCRKTHGSTPAALTKKNYSIT